MDYSWGSRIMIVGVIQSTPGDILSKHLAQHEGLITLEKMCSSGLRLLMVVRTCTSEISELHSVVSLGPLASLKLS